jgi:hypothetical protein
MIHSAKSEQINDSALQVTRPLTYLEVFVKWTHLPWWLIWTILPFVVFLVDRLISTETLGSHTLWKPLAVWVLFSGACSVHLVWASQQLQKSASVLGESIKIPKETFRRWYEDRLQQAFRSRWALTFAFAVLVLFLGTA